MEILISFSQQFEFYYILSILNDKRKIDLTVWGMVFWIIIVVIEALCALVSANDTRYLTPVPLIRLRKLRQAQ